MPIEVEAVAAEGTLPDRADVVVVGGGIIGVSTAYFLAERGVRVVLCEKGVIAGEQSSRNWGWCRSMGRDPREIPLMMESLRIWRGLDARIGAETGFRQTGTLYICPDEAAFAKREAWLPYARENGIDSVLLRGSDVSKVLPGAAVSSWTGALHTPSDGVAEPSLAVPAVARAARKLGAVILQNCAVRGLDTAAGRVAGAVTEQGRIAADKVVLAGGVWSSLFCRSVGVRFPQLKVLASVLRTAPMADGPSTAAWGPGLALRKRLDGGYTVASGNVIADIVPDSFRYFAEFIPLLRQEWPGISLRFGRAFLDEWNMSSWSMDAPSPFERVRTLDPPPADAEIARARANLDRSFPAFRGVATAARWGGMIDATPDLVPVISEVEAVPGLVLSSGYSGHGFGIGPGAGRLTADIATGSSPVVDPVPFRFSRFTDGSRPRPLTGF